MSSRASLRRKVVLPVTVIRHDGREKQIAHTLDLTGNSARVGGLTSMLDPGEIIEVQRGIAKGKFQVVWMGAQGGAMAGQAGIRGLDPNKCIWNVDLPEDENDITLDTASLRQPMPPVHTTGQFPGEKRWHPRYTCTGSVAVKTSGSTFAMNGEAKDISQGGIYIEMSAPLPVNSNVALSLSVEDVRFEATGVVRTSYPLLGMGVSFQNLRPESAEKLFIVLERAKRKAAQARAFESSLSSSPDLEDSTSFKPPATGPGSGGNPGLLALQACQTLANDFERCVAQSSPAEIDALKRVVSELEQKLAQLPPTGFMKCPASATMNGKPV